jgi:type VI protein secretion system component Hcp
VRERLTYANVVSTICLFIVLGGTSWAAISISGKNVKDSSLTSADIKNGSLLKKDFKAGQLPKGARGPQGPKGDTGATGAKGADLLAPPPSAPAAERLVTSIGTFPIEASSWGASYTPPAHTAPGAGNSAVTFDEVAVLTVPGPLSRELLDALGRSLDLGDATLEIGSAGSPAAVYQFHHLVLTGLSSSSSGSPRRQQVTAHITVSGLDPLTFNAGAPAPKVDETKVGDLTINGIQGTIDLYTDTWGVFGNANGTPSHPTFDDFVLVKRFDAASPALVHATLAGTEFTSATVRLFTPGTTNVESTFQLSDVRIPSYQVAVGTSALEQLSLWFQRITQTTGGVSRCFDLPTNTTC